MYWYLGGTAVCMIVIWKLKRKVPEQKSICQAVLILTIGFLLAFVLAAADESTREESQIARNNPGEGSRVKEYLVDAGDVLEEYPVEVQVEEKKLTDKQKQEYFTKAKEELDKVILGENESKDEITEPLNLPSGLLDGAVEVSYIFSDYQVFYPDGTLREPPKEPVLVEITAELVCQEETCLYEFFVQVVPKEKTEEAQLAEQLYELLEAENQKKDSAQMVLPKEINGMKVHWEEQMENRSISMVLLGIAGAVGSIFARKEAEKRTRKEKQSQMMLDYSDIVSKLALLLGAGMNISLAWEKVAMTYRDKREKEGAPKRYAYEEMLVTLYEIHDGVGELKAYENFGERCGMSVYRKLSALLVQNVRKGARGMQKLLEEEEREAFETRKAEARKAGEEAGTKLLLPMLLMLLIVLVILIVPAGLSMQM